MRYLAVTFLCLLAAACATAHKQPPQQQPSVYVVVFPRASLAISQQAAAVINSVAADANRHRWTMVEITGPSIKKARGYNPGLGRPRLVSLERALVAAGVDAHRILRNFAAPDLNADNAGMQKFEIRLVEKPEKPVS
jgi:hypothetical protein